MHRFSKASLTTILYIHMLDSSWGDYSQSIFVLVVLCLPHALHPILSYSHWREASDPQCSTSLLRVNNEVMLCKVLVVELLSLYCLLYYLDFEYVS